MPESKKDLSEKINGVLGLSPPIDFRKLTEKDLKRLWETLSKIPSLVQVGARASLERVMQGPVVTSVREVANMPMMQRFREIREAGGLLGLLDRRMKKTGEKKVGKTEDTAETA